MDLRDLLVPERLPVVLEHVVVTADEVGAQERVEGLALRALGPAPEDARPVHGLAGLEVGREGGFDGALAEDVAADEGAELGHVVGGAAQRAAGQAALVRGEALPLLEGDVGGFRARARGVEVVGGEAVFADEDAVRVEELAGRDHALVSLLGRLDVGEDSAGGVFGGAHVQVEELERVYEVGSTCCVEPLVLLRIPDFVILVQWRDVHVLFVSFESVLE